MQNIKFDPPVDNRSQDEKVANCVACTLATAMKDCQGCDFKIGRAVRVVHFKTLELRADPDQILELQKYWETLPTWLWEAYFKYAKDQIVIPIYFAPDYDDQGWEARNSCIVSE